MRKNKVFMITLLTVFCVLLLAVFIKGKHLFSEPYKEKIFDVFLIDMESKNKDYYDESAKIIVIDPGHQKKADYSKEQKGPRTTVKGTKVSQGTRGEFTGLWEYELNLMVGLKLKKLLTERGYKVYMTREKNDVYITNMQRAKFANKKKADLLLSLHANALPGKPEVEGVLSICMTKDSPYHPELYQESRWISDLILNKVAKKTKAKKLYVWERDNLAVLNWCEMPSTMLEMGFMTNEKEDKLLSQKEYQDKICSAIADSLDEFFDRK